MLEEGAMSRRGAPASGLRATVRVERSAGAPWEGAREERREEMKPLGFNRLGDEVHLPTL